MELSKRIHSSVGSRGDWEAKLVPFVTTNKPFLLRRTLTRDYVDDDSEDDDNSDYDDDDNDDDLPQPLKTPPASNAGLSAFDSKVFISLDLLIGWNWDKLMLQRCLCVFKFFYGKYDGDDK